MPLEIPSRACDTSDYKGQAIAVYHKGSETTTRLRRQRAIKAPSIPVQLTDELVELRDGSSEFPIKLPAMQKHVGESLPKLLGMLPDGTVVAWDFGYFSGRKKFILEAGQIKMTGDYASDLFDQPMCTANCDEIVGAIGYKVITETCIGQPSKEVYQLCRIPACCCPESEAEDCGDHPLLDDILDGEEV
jgi:hypothetical protein